MSDKIWLRAVGVLYLVGLTGCVSLTKEEVDASCHAFNNKARTDAGFFEYPCLHGTAFWLAMNAIDEETKQFTWMEVFREQERKTAIEREEREKQEKERQETAARKEPEQRQLATQAAPEDAPSGQSHREEAFCNVGIIAWMDNDSPMLTRNIPGRYFHAGTDPSRECDYNLRASPLTPLQRVEGGYLIVPAFLPDVGFSDGYSPVMLYTKSEFTKGQLLDGIVKYVGYFRYTGLDGFEHDIPAFRPKTEE